MSLEFRQVANGFAYRVRKFSRYDVNWYRFRTTSYDQSRANQKTTCFGVFTHGFDEVEYYGRIEETWQRSLQRSSYITRQRDWQMSPREPSLPSASPVETRQRGSLCWVSVTITWCCDDDFYLPSTRWHSATTMPLPSVRHHHLALWRRLLFAKYQVTLGKAFAECPTKNYTANKPLPMYSSPRLLCRESHSTKSSPSVF
jgi:hypothetical protein